MTAFMSPPTPKTNGGTDHGTSVLRWGTSWVQQVDAAISSNAVASISMTNSNTGDTADARLLANSSTQVLGLVMRSDAHTTNLVPGAGDAILYTSSTRLRLQWNGNMRAHGVGTDWVVGVGEGASTASAGGVRAPDIVGTNQPGAALTIRPGLSTGSGAGGSLILQSGTTGTTGSVQNAATTRITLSPTDTAFTGPVSADTSVWNLGSGQFYKDASGNIGVGTIAPGAPLHVQKSLAGALLVSLENTSNSASANARFLIKNDSGLTAGLQFWSSAAATPGLLTVYNAANAPLAFSTSAVERGRFTATGELVLGNGDTSATPTSSTLRGTNGVGTDIAGASLTVLAGRGTGAGAGGQFIVQTAPAGTTGTTLGTAANRLVIDQYGRWGVGAAPNTGWFNAGNLIDFVGGRGAVGIASGGSVDATFLSANALAASNDLGVTTWNYKATGTASKLELRSGVRLSVAASGTAGAAVTWADALVMTTASATFALPVLPDGNGTRGFGNSSLYWGPGYLSSVYTTGAIGHGTLSPVASGVQIGGGSTYRELRLQRNVDGTSGQALTFFRSRGTEAAPTALLTNDTIGSTIYSAHDGTSYVNCGSFGVAPTAAPSTGIVNAAFYMGLQPLAGGAITNYVKLTPAAWSPVANGGTSNGTSALRWSNVYAQAIDVAGGTVAVADAAGNWLSTKFDSQGIARNTLTSPAIVLNGASTDRPEVAFYRGARTYPEFVLREHTTADSGGEIWVGNGQAVPIKTVTFNSSVVGILSPTTQLGAGDNSAAPGNSVLRGADGAGTNISGASITIQPGRGTGTGAPGPGFLAASSAGSTGTTLQTAANIAQWTSTGLHVVNSGATLGYTTGAGGTTTQLTSKATGVTLSKPTGQITTAADALAAGALVSFTLTNTLLAATDNITVQRQSGGTAGAYRVWVDSVAAGSCVVCIENRSAGSLSEALVLNMNLHKGANA